MIPLKGALEKWYFEQRSFWVDLKIIAATALAIVAPRAKFYLKWFDVGGLVRGSSLRRYFVRKVLDTGFHRYDDGGNPPASP